MCVCMYICTFKRAQVCALSGIARALKANSICLASSVESVIAPTNIEKYFR